MNNKPVFIIMMGPPGSGKGFLMEPVIRYLNDKLKMNIIDVKRTIIDELVEDDPTFIERTSELLRKSWTHDEIKNIDLEKITTSIITKNPDDITNKLKTTAKNLTTIYFNIRKNHDTTNDNNIHKHLAQRDNIIFETTGQFSFDWLYKFFLKEDIRKDYNIVLVYPYVNRADIIKQAINRFKIQAEKVSNTNTWVRLPDLDDLYSSIETIQLNFITLLTKCKENRNLLDFIILYDNRPRYPDEPKIVLVNVCDHEDIMECSEIVDFIKTIDTDKSLSDKLKSLQCLKGGSFYNGYMRCRLRYLRLKYGIV